MKGLTNFSEGVGEYFVMTVNGPIRVTEEEYNQSLKERLVFSDVISDGPKAVVSSVNPKKGEVTLSLKQEVTRDLMQEAFDAIREPQKFHKKKNGKGFSKPDILMHPSTFKMWLVAYGYTMEQAEKIYEELPDRPDQGAGLGCGIVKDEWWE